MVTISVPAGLSRLKKKFRAEIGPGKTYWRARPAILTNGRDPLSNEDDEVSKETGQAIYLAQSDFEHLCVILSMDETDSYANQYREYFDIVVYERRLRKDNPAVQAAWEAYQIMLKLATPNDKDNF